jgi:HAD superfamily hydrolase (TIGR01484 family)
VDHVLQADASGRPFRSKTAHSNNWDSQFTVLCFNVSSLSERILGYDLSSIVVQAGDEICFVAKSSEIANHSLGHKFLSLRAACLVHYDAYSQLQGSTREPIVWAASIITTCNTFSSQALKLTEIEAIFSDYDGTLCALELRREDAFISPRLRRVLTKLSKQVKLGIITTKDLYFIKDRVPFAHGYAAASGLEMQVGDKTTLDERLREPDLKLEKTYQEALKKILQIRDNIMVERKEAEDGKLIAFCLDWRLSRNWDEAHRKAAPVLTLCKDHGLYVVESRISPFANVFPFEVDKGSAFVKLREEMGVKGPVMYLGDSEADDPPFQIADISVGIKHRRVMPPLKCKYRLEFFELEVFLSKLIDSNFNFEEGMLQKNT